MLVPLEWVKEMMCFVGATGENYTNIPSETKELTVGILLSFPKHGGRT